MSTESQLRDKLRKIEALFAGAGTPGNGLPRKRRSIGSGRVWRSLAGGIQLAFCLTHARRKFVAVFKSTKSPFAQEVVERIAAVYAIEKTIRGLDADQRRAARQAETKPLMTALKARLDATRDGLSIQSTLTEAINYTLNHWAGLILFLDDGRLEPDTNIVERSIRPIAIGRPQLIILRRRRRG